MAAADTSWILPLLNKSDPRHGKIRKAARGLTNILLPSLVLAEILQVTEFETRKQSGAKAGADAARKVYRALKENRAFEIVADYDVDVADEVYTRYGKLSYVDAAGVALALGRQTELLSLDEDQVEAMRSFR